MGIKPFRTNAFTLRGIVMRTRYLTFWVMMCCLLVALSTALSQSPTVSSIVAPVNQLSVSDIDFRHSTTPKWLFTINIQVVGTRTVTMAVRAGFSIPNRGDYPIALTFGTDSFTVRGTRSVSNLDLDRTIRLISYNLDNTAKRSLEETALSSGQIPAGTYTFNVDVTYVDGSAPPGHTEFKIVLSNPTTVELISPVDDDQFANQFPLFQWLYDGPSSRISVFEKLPGQTSLEEAASGVPQFTKTTTANSMQYPSSGARILEPGKTYVWFVEGLSGVAGGTAVGRKSSLRSFTVASNGSQTLSSLLDELARALPRYQSLFDELKAQGFTTAGSLHLNGTAISIADLQRLVNTLRQNPDAVTTVELE